MRATRIRSWTAVAAVILFFQALAIENRFREDPLDQKAWSTVLAFGWVLGLALIVYAYWQRRLTPAVLGVVWTTGFAFLVEHLDGGPSWTETAFVATLWVWLVLLVWLAAAHRAVPPLIFLAAAAAVLVLATVRWATGARSLLWQLVVIPAHAGGVAVAYVLWYFYRPTGLWVEGVWSALAGTGAAAALLAAAADSDAGGNSAVAVAARWVTALYGAGLLAIAVAFMRGRSHTLADVDDDAVDWAHPTTWRMRWRRDAWGAWRSGQVEGGLPAERASESDEWGLPWGKGESQGDRGTVRTMWESSLRGNGNGNGGEEWAPRKLP